MQIDSKISIQLKKLKHSPCHVFEDTTAESLDSETQTILSKVQKADMIELGNLTPANKCPLFACALLFTNDIGFAFE